MSQIVEIIFESDDEVEIVDLPPVNQRIIGEKYKYEGKIRIWNGKELLCKHRKYKYKCINCNGCSICDHNKRSICRLCKGNEICEHNRRRCTCKLCKGSEICSHNKIKSTCRMCKGVSICEHDKRRNQCILCKGSRICIHKKQKHQCVLCKGNGICKHNKIKSRCNICFTHPQNFCKSCKYIYVKNGSYYPYCIHCYYKLNPDIAPSRFRMKEFYIGNFIDQEFPDYNFIHNKTIGGCSQRRPDWLYDGLTHSVIIECDEEGHKAYSCENKRMMEIFQDLGNRPVVFIRFNPDKYKGKECFYYDEKNVLQVKENEWKKRSDKLKERIEYHLENIPDKEVTSELLFY